MPNTQNLVSTSLKYSIYCVSAIDITGILWYNPLVIDSMCVSSPSREGRPASTAWERRVSHCTRYRIRWPCWKNSRDALRGVFWVCTQEPVESWPLCY